MGDDEFWNEKRIHTNPFDQPDHVSHPGRQSIPTSARSRRTSTLTHERVDAPRAASPSSTIPRDVRPSLPAVMPSPTPPSRVQNQPTGGDASSPYLVTCAKCQKKSEVRLVTRYEGSLVFCGDACWKAGIKETAEDLTQGRSDRMYQLKSLMAKRQLLDLVLESLLADAIVLAVTYMARTSGHCVVRELVSRPVALRHYVDHLLRLGQTEEAADILDASGDSGFEEAAMLRLRRIVADPNVKEERLTNVANLPKVVVRLNEQRLALIELQGKMENKCQSLNGLAKVLEDEANRPPDVMPNPQLVKAPKWLERIPVPPSLRGVPLLSCVLFSVFFNEGVSGEVMGLLKPFDIHERTFAWVCAQALGMLHKWGDLQQAVVQKKWIRSNRSIIPPGRVARLVHTLSADDEQNQREVFECKTLFLRMVENPDERLDLARKLGVWKVAVNVAVQQRDRELVVILHQGHEPGSEAFSATRTLLETPINKWRQI